MRMVPKRMGVWMMVGVVFVGVGVGGCDEPEVAPPRAVDSPVKADPFTIVYKAERLAKLGMLKPGMTAQQFEALMAAPPEAGRARFEIRPLGFERNCLPVGFPRDSLPVMCKVGLNLASREEISNPCVFDALIGPEGKGQGTFTVSEKDIDEIVKEGEPVYAVTSGYVIMGGKNPVARGRRSRAGAPGTWVALKVEGDDPNQESYREVYFLLNTVDDAKRKVRVYLGVPKLPHEGGGAENPCPPQAGAKLEFNDRDKAVVVKGNCTFEVIDLGLPEHSSLKAFRDHAAELARCARLTGNEPVPDDPTSGSTTASPAESTPR